MRTIDDLIEEAEQRLKLLREIRQQLGERNGKVKQEPKFIGSVSKEDRRQQIAEQLTKFGPLSAKELGKLCECSHQTIYQTLNRCDSFEKVDGKIHLAGPTNVLDESKDHHDSQEN